MKQSSHAPSAIRHTPTIGIVGGGQLAKMLTIAAKSLGFYVIVTDPTPHSPAGQVADEQIVADYKDAKATLTLGKLVDFLTIDAEFVNTDALEKLENLGKKVNPSPATICMIKDKLSQKMFLKKHKISTADFVNIDCHSGENEVNDRIYEKDAITTLQHDNIVKQIEHTAKKFDYPLLLKARFDAYDGKGNFVVKNKSDIKKGLEVLQNRKLYVEKFVRFKKELAVMIARDVKGNILSYPVVETIHKNNICDVTLCPPKISRIANTNALALAKKVMQHMIGSGVFGIEMFLVNNDTVLVNEIAPRVHNSGHYTIEGCVTSQFEQHIRAISGLPLGATDLLPKAVVMKNILADMNGSGQPKGLEKALAIKNVSVHVYSKLESRPNRKMGHITVIGETIETCLKKANLARKLITI